MAQQVFISYASADKKTADRVCESLEQAGVSCWIAPRNIEAGADYPAAIVAAVHSARVLVLILTEQAAASPHILSEVGHAFNDRKRIIPFRLSSGALPADLEYFLSLTQWLDAADGCTDQNLKRLTEATLDALAGRSTPRQPQPPKRRVGWLSGLAAALAAVAALVIFLRFPKRPPPGPVRQSPLVVPAPSSSPPVVIPEKPPASARQRTWLNPADGQIYVRINPGTFIMGCSAADNECKDDEKPAHPVEIAKAFWMGQAEVTVGAWRKYAAKHGLDSPSGDDSLPMTDVTWGDARRYCAANGGRLPAEAEWEYAARGGVSQPYYGVVSSVAWYEGNSGGAKHPVRMKMPNRFGLYDMLGNVKEWVLDRYFNEYDMDAPATGAEVAQPVASNAYALARGGSWDSDRRHVRVSSRNAREPDMADGAVGFRCASDHR